MTTAVGYPRCACTSVLAWVNESEYVMGEEGIALEVIHIGWPVLSSHQGADSGRKST